MNGVKDKIMDTQQEVVQKNKDYKIYKKMGIFNGGGKRMGVFKDNKKRMGLYC